MLWQLKKLSTNQALSDPKPLPENWGPIFGLHNIKDRIGELSWLGNAYADMGWVQVDGKIEDLAAPVNVEEQVRKTVNNCLAMAQQRLASDDLTIAEKSDLLEYEAKLQQIPSQKGFPEGVVWPLCPFENE